MQGPAPDGSATIRPRDGDGRVWASGPWSESEESLEVEFDSRKVEFDFGKWEIRPDQETGGGKHVICASELRSREKRLRRKRRPEPVEVTKPEDFPLAKCYRFDPKFKDGEENDEANVHLLAALGKFEKGLRIADDDLASPDADEPCVFPCAQGAAAIAAADSRSRAKRGRVCRR